MSQNNRQLAFPSPSSEGMLLRDYFAAKAMQGLISVDAVWSNDNRAGRSHEEMVAHYAYKQADALLKERESE